MTAQDPTPVVFSLIVPLRNEGDGLESFHEQLAREAGGLLEACELIYVDDGSSDETVSVLERLAGAVSNVVVVELSRAFGSAGAVTAGAAVARGRAVITFDRRCGRWPELLTQMVNAWREGFEIVHVGGRADRRGALRQILAQGDAGDRVQMRLIDRAVLAALDPADASRSIDQRISHVGFRQNRLPADATAAAALEPAGRKRTDAPGALSKLGLAAAGVLLGGSALFYLISMILLLAGKNTGPESRMTAVVAGLAGLQLGVLAAVGRFMAGASERLSRRPIYAVRRVVGAADEAPAQAAGPVDSEFGSYVVYT